MIDDIDAQIAQTLTKIQDHAATAIGSGGLDDLKVKELRLKGLQQAEQVMANDQKASIMSVIVYVAVT